MAQGFRRRQYSGYRPMKRYPNKDGFGGKAEGLKMYEGSSMKKLNVLVSTVISTVFFFIMQVPCRAADAPFKEILHDSIYGGLAGTVIGAAVLAFTKRPGDHLEYMAYGAAAGVLGGAAYGYFASRALIEVDKGKVKFAIPMVMPDFRGPSGKSNLVVTTELIKGNF
jgi:hypothetical protein